MCHPKMEISMSFMTLEKKQTNPRTWWIWKDQESGDKESFERRISFESVPLWVLRVHQEERGGRFYLPPSQGRGAQALHGDGVSLAVRETWLLFGSCLEMVKGKDRSVTTLVAGTTLGETGEAEPVRGHFQSSPWLLPGGSPPGQLGRKEGPSQSKMHYLWQNKSNQI